jgi:hypothetical protein
MVKLMFTESGPGDFQSSSYLIEELVKATVEFERQIVS